MAEPPARIEGFDISNISGTFKVASMVSFWHGRPDRAGYRRFRMKTVTEQNDFACMAETIRRRYSRLQREVKSAVVRGSEAELFIVAVDLEGTPTLVLLESSTKGVSIEADPSMGLRAAGLSRLILEDVDVDADAILGEGSIDDYRECIRLSRLAWAGRPRSHRN